MQPQFHYQFRKQQGALMALVLIQVALYQMLSAQRHVHWL